MFRIQIRRYSGWRLSIEAEVLRNVFTGREKPTPSLRYRLSLEHTSVRVLQKGLATALPCALNEPIFYPSSRRGGVARPENIEDLMTRAKNSTVVFLAYRCNPKEAITKRPPPSNLN